MSIQTEVITMKQKMWIIFVYNIYEVKKLGETILTYKVL